MSAFCGLNSASTSACDMLGSRASPSAPFRSVLRRGALPGGVDNFEIPSQRAIVLGLLISALIRDTISRSSRAALAADITVGARTGNCGVLLEVIDGAPIPADAPHDALTLSDFVRQLGGQMSVMTTAGSNVRILLPQG